MKSGNSSRVGSAPDKRVGIELELIEIEAGAYRFDLSLPVADARRSQELFVSHMNVPLSSIDAAPETSATPSLHRRLATVQTK